MQSVCSEDNNINSILRSSSGVGHNLFGSILYCVSLELLLVSALML
jgi:hypothetical protein